MISAKTSRRTPQRAFALLAAVFAVGACAPITTNKAYEASDGVGIDVGNGLRAMNVLVLTSGEGEPGALVGAFNNTTDEKLTVAVKPEFGRTTEFSVDAGSVLSLPEAHSEDIGDIAVAPGGTIALTVSSDGHSVTAPVPVLDGTLSEYADLVPESTTKN